MAAAYSASKAAVIALAKAIGKDVAGTGVLVNAIAPAVIETPILDRHVRGARRVHARSRCRSGAWAPRPRSRTSSRSSRARISASRPAPRSTSPADARPSERRHVDRSTPTCSSRRRLRRRRSPRASCTRPATRCACSRRATGSAGAPGSARGALAGRDLEMGGAWIVPEQRHVWAEVERYGLERAVLGPAELVRLDHRRRAAPRARCRCRRTSCPSSSACCFAMREAAARLDLSRPLAGQDVADLDATPSDVWLERLGAADAHARARPRLVQRHGVGDAGRVLDPRGRALARGRGQQHLALARGERARPRARARHRVARRGDR